MLQPVCTFSRHIIIFLYHKTDGLGARAEGVLKLLIKDVILNKCKNP